MVFSNLPDSLAVGHLTVIVITTLVLGLLLQLVFKIVMLFIQRKRDLEALKEFPGPPPHWLFGNLRELPPTDVGLQKTVDWIATYGPIYPVWIGPFVSYLWCRGPNSIQTITKTAEPKDPVVYRFIEPWIGDGLLVSKGKKWARNRRLLTPAFHFDILKPYVRFFSDSTHVMITKWKGLLQESPSKSIEMFDHVSLMTLHTLLKCIFGYDSNCQTEGKKNPYIQAVYALTDLAVKRFRFFPYHNDWIYYFSYQGYKFRQACKHVHTFSHEVITARQAQRQTLKEQGEVLSNKKYLDFLDMLLDARDEDGTGLSFQEIQDEVDTFMFEGHDTTASGISWCLYNLARHPEHQEKCRQEVNDLLGEREHMEWEDMSSLPYLTMCIKESLRLHPPVPNIARKTTKPLSFPDGRSVPEGTWIGCGIYACHHNPDVWEEAETYNPLRFTPENSKDRSSHAFVPFSAGPRNCIGQHFAMNELKTAVGLVVRHFAISVDETRTIVKIPELVLRAKDGLWLKLTPLV